MKPAWATSHTFIVVIGCVMAVLTYLVHDPTLGPYAQTALAILTALIGYLGLSSGQAFGKPKVPPVVPGVLLMVFLGGSWVMSPIHRVPVEEMGLQGCNKPLPPNTPADVSGAIECVTSALLTTGIPGLSGCVITWGPALVADALQILLASKFATEHPELVPAMNAKILELRASK
jgi:hypothetical protein